MALTRAAGLGVTRAGAARVAAPSRDVLAGLPGSRLAGSDLPLLLCVRFRLLALDSLGGTLVTKVHP